MTASINSIQPGGLAAVDDSRRANKANLDKAAQKFEAVFVNMMLKEARKTSIGSGLFENDAMKTFRDMQDTQVAQEMGKRGTLGIAKALSAYFESIQPLDKGDDAKGAVK